MDREAQDYVPGGNVLVARAIRQSPLWTWDSEHLRLWIYLLTSVNASETPIVIGYVTVGYGQVLKSHRRIADENEYTANNKVARWSTSRVSRMLDRFERAGMVTTLGTDLGTLLTVRNFRKYQDFGTYRSDLGTDLGTGSEQARNNNKQSIQSNDTNPPSENCSTDTGRAVLNFVERVGCTWSLKATPDRWADGLLRQYPHVRLIDELARAGDYHEEQHAIS